MMREVYKEEDFYKDEGGPSERLVYSKYILNIIGEDYDQFILVVNAEEVDLIDVSPRQIVSVALLKEEIVNTLVEALL